MAGGGFPANATVEGPPFLTQPCDPCVPCDPPCHRRKAEQLLCSSSACATASITTPTTVTPEAVLPQQADLLAELRNSLATYLLQPEAFTLQEAGSSSDEDCEDGHGLTPRLHSSSNSTGSSTSSAGRGLMAGHEGLGSRAEASSPTTPDLDPHLQFEPEFAPGCYEGAGRVLVCQGSKCQAKGAGAVLRGVAQLSAGSPGVEVVPCKCLGRCKVGPAMRVKHDGRACSIYTELVPSQLPEVFRHHFEHAVDPAAPELVPLTEEAMHILKDAHHIHLPQAACCAECQHDDASEHAPHAPHAHTA